MTARCVEAQLVPVTLYEFSTSFTRGEKFCLRRRENGGPTSTFVPLLENVRNKYDFGHSVYFLCPSFTAAVPEHLHTSIFIVLRRNCTIPLLVHQYSLLLCTKKISKCLTALFIGSILPSNPKKAFQLVHSMGIDDSR